MSARTIRYVATFSIAGLLFASMRNSIVFLHSPTNAPIQHHAAINPASSPPPPPAPADGVTSPNRPLLDGSLSAALSAAVPSGAPKVVLVAFGNSKVGPVLSNFVQHATAVGAPFIVGAVDAALFDRLAAASTPVYKTPLAMQSFQLDGANSHASSSWNRFAVMRSGEVAKIVLLGYDVLHTDVDVAWLRNPAPYIACDSSASLNHGDITDPPQLHCSTLSKADVAVSTDSMSPGQEAREGVGYLVSGTLNSGLLLIRATPAGRAFASNWHGTVVRRSCPVTGRSNCSKLCNGWCAPDGSCAGDCNENRCCTTDQQVLNRMVKTPPPSGRSNNHWTGLAVPRGSPRTTRAANDTIVLGALPLALFLHGHGYFVQKRALQPQSPAGLNSMISSARPYAVHATYTLDDHEGLAKAQRFREGGLWRVDPDDYYEGTYLAYNASTPPKLQAAIDEYVGGNGGTKAAASIGLHVAALSEYVAELRDALALARALKRTLILPRWTCYCDRLWSGSDDIFHFGCMYPGAQDAKFVPFVCPMDHVLSPTEWEKAGVEHRDAAFIDRLYERAAAHSASPPSIVEVMVGGKANGHAHLPLGVSDQHAAMVLQPYASAKVIRLSSAHGLLCGIEGAENAASFDKLVRWPTTGLLQPPPWCSTCYQRCDVELTKWLSAAQIAKGVTHDPKRWCAHWDRPASLPDAEAGCLGSA